MLTYLQVHLYYTIPPTIILYLFTRPFIGSFDKIKFVALCCLALIYTTPWDNYIIYHKAWWYRKDAVVGTIGYVPIEKYLFVIIQTLFTAMWTTFCSRWTMHALYLRTTSRSSFYFTRYSVICSAGVVIAIAWLTAQPTTKVFYFGCILWWTLLVIALIWFVAGAYIVKRYKETIIAVAIPSIYMCYVDMIALRANVWHINEATSMGIFPVDDLPVEEVLFLFMTNVIVAFGCHAFDKCKAVIDTFYREPFAIGESASPLKRFFEYAGMALDHSVYNEYIFDESVLDDLETCIAVLNKTSYSLSLTTKCCSSDINQDITILYAFCRVTDDMVDNEDSVHLKKERVKIIVEFLGQLFANQRITSEYCWEIITEAKSNIDWKYFEKHLTKEQVATFRAFSRIAYYMPQEPFYKLVDGYNWDIDGRPVLDENDLIEYSKCAASSVVILATIVFCHKSNRWPDERGDQFRSMIENARKMGPVLQLCNISRDIIADSETLGRCYIPHSYISKDELKYLLVDRDPSKVPNIHLKNYAEKMLNIADGFASDAKYGLIKLLPSECQRPFLSTLEVSEGIGRAIRSNPSYSSRTSPTKWQKIRIALNCMYFMNISTLDKRRRKSA